MVSEYLDCPKCKKNAIPEDHRTGEERAMWRVGLEQPCPHCGVRLRVMNDRGYVEAAHVVDLKEALSEELRGIEHDLALLTELRAHPNFQDIVDWIDRAAGMWVGHPRYQGAAEAGKLLEKLLRGAS